MPTDESLVTRLVARVRALFPKDWKGRAGARFRQSCEEISRFAEQQSVRPADLAEDAVRKLKGVTNKEFAEATRAFAESEKAQIEAETKRRTADSDVAKAKAEAEIAKVKALSDKYELFNKLKAAGLILVDDGKGNYSVLPAPPDFDFNQLFQRPLVQAKDAGEDQGPDDPDPELVA